MPFNIGDTIIMAKVANNHYSRSRAGSIGVIIDYDPRRQNWDGMAQPYLVKFSKLTGNHSGENMSENFWVDSVHFEGYVEATPQEKVILKIRDMENRRKELGYAF
jgi:hypothetical protein